MRITAAIITLLLVQTASWASLSDNAVSDGDFEDNSHVKTENFGSTGKRPWQFIGQYTEAEQLITGRENDLGMWIDSTPGLQGLGTWDGPAMTTFDNPQLEWATNGTGIERGMGGRNVSLIDGDHVLECTGFRKGAGQILAAPANHVAGTATINFDYYWTDWEGTRASPVAFQMRVYGVPTLPSFVDLAMWSPPETLTGGELDQVGGTCVYASPEWNLWGDSQDPNVIRNPVTPVQWRTLSDDFDVNFTVDQAYPYYYVRLWMRAYVEPHVYWWWEGGRVVDTLAIALDDIDLRLPVENVPGDFSDSGSTNLLDINPFVQAITDLSGYQAAYPYVHIPTVDPGPVLGSPDGIINLLDIPAFVALLTGGATTAIPEPSIIGVVLVGGVMGLARRRR